MVLVEENTRSVMGLVDAVLANEIALPKAIEGILNLETNLGVPVRNIRMQAGHCLVFKIPMRSVSKGVGGMSIQLPDQYTRRSTNNVTSIFGLVIRSSEPFNHLIPEKYKEFSSTGESSERTRLASVGLVKSVVSPGDGVVYAAYNRGKLVLETHEKLVFVREVDLLSSFDLQDYNSLELGDIALTRGVWA